MRVALLIGLIFLSLSACMREPPPQLPFNEAELKAMDIRGNASINGTAFVQFSGGGAKSCANERVFLVADGEFVRAFDVKLQEWDPKPALRAFTPRFNPPAYPNAMRTTVCDLQGNFQFDQVAPGKWYLMTRIRTSSGKMEVNDGYTTLRKFVTLASGEQARPVLNYGDAAYQYGS